MASLFRQVGIYAPAVSSYEPEDAHSMLAYREAPDGQLLEGITEAGALSSWIAAATSYSVHGRPMLPFYIYYSMFGFQRVGDLIWAAADQRAAASCSAPRPAARRSAAGPQHQDGTSHVVAATVPELPRLRPRVRRRARGHPRSRHAADDGWRVDEFYYVTVMNENYAQPSLPEGAAPRRSCAAVPVRCVRRWAPSCGDLGSGRSCARRSTRPPIAGGGLGRGRRRCSADELLRARRDAREVERWNRLHPARGAARAHVATLLAGDAPIVAATDYVRAYPQLVAPVRARRSRRSAPTASGAATRAPPARILRGEPRASWWRRCRRSRARQAAEAIRATASTGSGAFVVR